MSPSSSRTSCVCLCGRPVHVDKRDQHTGIAFFEGVCECGRALWLKVDLEPVSSAEPATSPASSSSSSAEDATELPFVPEHQVRPVQIEVGDESTVPLDALFRKSPAGGAA